jgi:hypothetical protein
MKTTYKSDPTVEYDPPVAQFILVDEGGADVAWEDTLDLIIQDARHLYGEDVEVDSADAPAPTSAAPVPEPTPAPAPEPAPKA